jgi:4-hydroxybenzoyl-CoA thioesterase
MMQARRLSVPTVKLEMNFVAPGYHGDRMDFAVHVHAVGTSSVTFDHFVSVGGRPIWSARQVGVATSMDSHKSIPWPDDIRAALLRQMDPTEPNV